MKHRLIVVLDSEQVTKFQDHLDILCLSDSKGFYHIKILKNTVIQFWFELQDDYDACYNKLIEFKMSHF